MGDVEDFETRKRLARIFGRPVDKDVAWAIRHVRENAELSSMCNGGDDESTLQDRRLETVVMRLAREAGYDTATVDFSGENDDG